MIIWALIVTIICAMGWTIIGVVFNIIINFLMAKFNILRDDDVAIYSLTVACWPIMGIGRIGQILSYAVYQSTTKKINMQLREQDRKQHQLNIINNEIESIFK